MRFLCGVSLGAIPFIPVIWSIGPTFTQSVLRYGSSIDNWGINQFLREGNALPKAAASRRCRDSRLIARYYTMGRLVILAAVVLLAVRGRRDRRIDGYALACCTLCLFLILTPGWGMQYLIIPLPLLYATGRFLPATLYSLLAGVLCLFTAWQNWLGSWPIDSDTIIGPVAPGPLFAAAGVGDADRVCLYATEAAVQTHSGGHQPMSGTSEIPMTVPQICVLCQRAGQSDPLPKLIMPATGIVAVGSPGWCLPTFRGDQTTRQRGRISAGTSPNGAFSGSITTIRISTIRHCRGIGAISSIE